MQNNAYRRILLLSPDTTEPIFNQNGCLKSERFSAPLGLGYLSSVLKKEGYLVKVVDGIGKPTPVLKKEIITFKPELVGISCFTEHRGGSLALARLVKKIDQKIPVVFGGSQATFMYQQILSSYPEVDFCVLGEGEITFKELLGEIFSRKRYDRVLGIAFRRGNKTLNTGPRPWVENLDDLPFPDRGWMEEIYSFPHREAGKRRVATFITSRGCPFGCQFCSTSEFWGKRTRFRSVKNIIEEIDSLWKEGYKVLNFLDDTFTLNEERVQKLCLKMIENKYDFAWCCSTRAGMVSQKTARLMKESGCFSITLGIESLSPKVLNNISKKISVSQVEETCGHIKKAGIKCGCLLMVGNQGENTETIMETIANLKLVNPDSIFTNLTQVYPATKLYEIAKKAGLVGDDYWLDEKKAAPIYLAENSLENLLSFEKKIWESFFWQKKDYPRWFSRKSRIGGKIWPIIGAIYKKRGE